ncbi:hypothetical protein [Actinomadura sediminis]|uniref:Uncharacterized protein n=1 Tax=Actinomadura sediminis TaxID=1038904 RepID=A0ABW3ETD9_9ACTN
MTAAAPRREKSGWTVYCSEVAADVLESVPPPVRDDLIDFLCDLARRGGGAVDAGLPPPGRPLDGVGVHYTHTAPGTAACIEYLVLADIKEFYVADLVWAG